MFMVDIAFDVEYRVMTLKQLNLMITIFLKFASYMHLRIFILHQ